MIHNQSIIDPRAKIGKNVSIGPFTTISEDVEIGDGTYIGPNVHIMDGVTIGKNCKIFPGAIVGAIPQDLKFGGEESCVIIGNNVIIREYCTINRGTKANHDTLIGDDCLLMAYVHVAHDCIIRPKCILANNVNLAGHIEIGEYAILGGLVAVHQFVNIGKHAMIGGGSLVRKDVPPFIKSAREPLAYTGVNSIGLSRRNFSREQIRNIQDIYRVLFVKGFNTTQALEIIRTEMPETKEKDDIMDFILNKSTRGLLRAFYQNK